MCLAEWNSHAEVRQGGTEQWPPTKEQNEGLRPSAQEAINWEGELNKYQRNISDGDSLGI